MPKCPSCFYRDSFDGHFCSNCGYTGEPPKEIHNEGPGLAFWMPVFIPLGLIMWGFLLSWAWRGFNRFWIERHYVSRAEVLAHR